MCETVFKEIWKHPVTYACCYKDFYLSDISLSTVCIQELITKLTLKRMKLSIIIWRKKMKGRKPTSSYLIKKNDGWMMTESSVVDVNFLVIGSEIIKGNIIKRCDRIRMQFIYLTEFLICQLYGYRAQQWKYNISLAAHLFLDKFEYLLRTKARAGLLRPSPESLLGFFITTLPVWLKNGKM